MENPRAQKTVSSPARHLPCRVDVTKNGSLHVHSVSMCRSPSAKLVLPIIKTKFILNPTFPRIFLVDFLRKNLNVAYIFIKTIYNYWNIPTILRRHSCRLVLVCNSCHRERRLNWTLGHPFTNTAISKFENQSSKYCKNTLKYIQSVHHTTLAATCSGGYSYV